MSRKANETKGNDVGYNPAARIFLMLFFAVLAILITAPLGAIGMDATSERMLQK